MTRGAPPIDWRAVLIGGAVAVGTSLLLSISSQVVGAGSVGAGIAAGAAVAGRLAKARSAFHGGLVAVLWIAAEALADPLRPAPGDALSDTALTVVADVIRLGLGVLFGWLGGHTARWPGVGGGRAPA